MRQIVFLMVLSGLCLSAPMGAQGTGEDQRFETLAKQYVDLSLVLNPEWATSLGDHNYDHLMNDYSLKAVTRDIAFSREFLDSLAVIDPTKLSTANRIDYEILEHSLRYTLFSLDTLRSYERNPRRYNVGGAIYILLARDFAPLTERLRSVKGRLAAVPEILEQAKLNLKNPPRIYTETAIAQNAGTIALIRDDLNAYLDSVPAMREEIQPLQKQAVAALEAFGTWMQNELLPRSDGDFRLGKELYRAKLRYTVFSDLTPEEILARAEADLIATTDRLYETALPLFDEYFPDQRDSAVRSDPHQVIKMVLDRLAEDHPSADNCVDVAEKALQECETFVRRHDLVSLPDEPIKVVVMPEFERGVAVAYCDSPGPLEERGQTFFAISPPPKEWDAARVESFFREYNNYQLRNLTVHEAMPGHYLQAMHANRLKAPTMIRAIYGSGTFVEGWATYAEEMMVEHGFGGAPVKMQQLKMRLRMIINVIIDQKIHTAGMTEQEAMDLMIKDGFQEEGEAAGKWRRACLSSTQLSSYYIGNIEVGDIRKAYEAKHGKVTDYRAFHDKMLSFGSPPARIVKELMGL
jgi:uncharacterized protein (DUF885 family)